MSNRRTRLPATLLALALALAACTGGAVGTGDVESLDLATGTGPLPAATFNVLGDDATEVSVTDWRGTPTIVNFWATWCGFCVEELPQLQAAHVALGDAVRFVGIDQQDVAEDAVAFLADAGVTYEQVASPDGGYYSLIGARGMPTTLFVDADGVVAYRHTGPLTERLILDLAAEHLGVGG